MSDLLNQFLKKFMQFAAKNMPNKRLAPSPRLAPLWENIDPPPVLTVCFVKFSQQMCEIKEMLALQVGCPTKIFYVDPPLCSSYPILTMRFGRNFFTICSLEFVSNQSALNSEICWFKLGSKSSIMHCYCYLQSLVLGHFRKIMTCELR